MTASTDAPERLREIAEATEPRLRLLAPFFVWPGPETTEILLIRHGQIPESTTIDDASLTELGHEQAEALSEFLASPAIAAVYASPSGRAIETARAIATRHGLEVEVLEALADVDNKLPPGLTPQEALVQALGDAEGNRRYEAMVSGGWSLDLFGGLLESSASLRERVAGAIDGVVRSHPGARVAVVSHAPPIAAYVAHILGSPSDFPFYPRLTGITSLLAREERRQLVLLNGAPHFGVL